MEMNEHQFGQYASGTDHYPKHAAGSQMGGSDTGRHVKTTKNGKRVASKSDPTHVPQHAKSSLGTSQGRHTAGGVMKAAHGAMKAARKLVGR
jgi:hypothetical protein